MDSLLLATVRIEGGILVKTADPARLRHAAGRTLEVRVPYHLAETSKDRERYRILLTTSLDGHAPPPVLFERGDRWALHDEHEGVLTQSFDLEPGVHELAWELDVEYSVEHWSTGNVLHTDRQRQRGKVHIVVEAAGATLPARPTPRVGPK